jgi:hypothetical protein
MQFPLIARLSAKLAAALVLVLGLTSQQASAATITATFAGTVKTATDSTGVFGTPGADLAGASDSLVFTVDPTVGTYFPFNGTITDPLLSGDNVFGGISAVMTINGHSYSFIGSNSPSSNYDLAATKPGFGAISYQVSNFGLPYAFAGLETTNLSGFPTSVFSAVSLNSCPAGSCTFGGNFAIPGSPGHDLVGTLNFGSFTVTTTPIPAALPLLVSALGGLGFVGWRRKQSAAA